jgi:dTMP kinase
MPAVGLLRAGGRRGAGAPDRLEAETPAFHEGVRRAYLALAAAEPGRIRVVDAAAGLDRVWEDVRRHLEAILPTGATA